jgi:hypothetical protein
MPFRLTDLVSKIPLVRKASGSRDLEDVIRAEFSGEISHDKQLAALRYRSSFFDDFIGAGQDTRFSTTAGSGTANAALTTVANALNGEQTIKSASNNGTHAANGSTVTLDDLGYKANQGGLVLEARAKFDSLTSLWAFIGFTDTISTTVEYPIGITGTTPNSDATDAIGFVYDATATNTAYAARRGGQRCRRDAVQHWRPACGRHVPDVPPRGRCGGRVPGLRQRQSGGLSAIGRCPSDDRADAGDLRRQHNGRAAHADDRLRGGFPKPLSLPRQRPDGGGSRFPPLFNPRGA